MLVHDGLLLLSVELYHVNGHLPIQYGGTLVIQPLATRPLCIVAR